MPTSEMKAVPRGRIWWSAVGACVCVPTTRLARPSQKWPIACFALVAGERVIQGVHEDAAHGVDDEHARAVLRVDHCHAAAGRAGGIIDWAQQPRRAFDENQRLLLVPGVVAAGDHVGAGIDEFLVDGFGNAEAAGGVLAVDRHEIELPVAHEGTQALEQDRAPAAPYDVADEEDAHASGGSAVDDLALG